jgi:negative regulator of replication initiation
MPSVVRIAKQRALEEMEVALRDMLRSAASQQKQLYVEKLTAILDALTRPEPQAQPDWTKSPLVGSIS